MGAICLLSAGDHPAGAAGLTVLAVLALVAFSYTLFLAELQAAQRPTSCGRWSGNPVRKHLDRSRNLRSTRPFSAVPGGAGKRRRAVPLGWLALGGRPLKARRAGQWNPRFGEIRAVSLSENPGLPLDPLNTTERSGRNSQARI
jgi:hypothetical protein